jgi:hypothetical protein
MSGEQNQQIPQVLNPDIQCIMETMQQDQTHSIVGFTTQYLQMTQNPTPVKVSRKQKFTPEEDEELKAYYSQCGPDWKMIAALMKNRTPRQCRDRWKNYLSPNVNTRPWTPEEDALLFEKFKEYGRQWATIAKFFNQRTDIHIKNHWVTISNKPGIGIVEPNPQQPPQLQMETITEVPPLPQ